MEEPLGNVEEIYLDPEGHMYLSTEEVLKLELSVALRKIESLEIKLFKEYDKQRQLEVDNLKKQGEILLLKAEAKKFPEPKHVQQLQLRTVQLRKLEEEAKLYQEELRERYGFTSEVLGYDPETRRIVDDEEESK